MVYNPCHRAYTGCNYTSTTDRPQQVSKYENEMKRFLLVMNVRYRNCSSTGPGAYMLYNTVLQCSQDRPV